VPPRGAQLLNADTIPASEQIVMSLSRLRMFWIAAWVVIGAIPVAWTLANEPPEGSIDHLTAEGTDEATLHGVTLAIQSVRATSSETLVVIACRGREDDGAMVNILGGVQLLGDDGSPVRFRAADHQGRTLLLYFAELPEGSQAVSISIGGLALSVRDPGVANPQDRTFIGSYRISVSAPKISRSVSSKISLKETVAFGFGALTLTELLVDDDVVAFRGTLEGFTEEQLVELFIAPASLSDSEGRPFIFKDSLQNVSSSGTTFELRFEGQAKDSILVLEVPFRVDESPRNTAAASSMKPWDGSVARVVVDARR
jgi:hypothetical protein